MIAWPIIRVSVVGLGSALGWPPFDDGRPVGCGDGDCGPGPLGPGHSSNQGGASCAGHDRTKNGPAGLALAARFPDEPIHEKRSKAEVRLQGGTVVSSDECTCCVCCEEPNQGPLRVSRGSPPSHSSTARPGRCHARSVAARNRCAKTAHTFDQSPIAAFSWRGLRRSTKEPMRKRQRVQHIRILKTDDGPQLTHFFA